MEKTEKVLSIKNRQSMRFLLSFIIIIFSIDAFGQSITKVTAQHWAGGACCASGTNYTIILQLEENSSAQIESVWLDGYGEMESSIFQDENSTIVNIQFGIATNYNDHIGLNYQVQYDATKDKEGVAQITLIENGEKQVLLISRFEQLRAIPYP